MNKFVFLVLVLLAMSFVSGLCEEGQIDINEASVKELDNLYGVGEVKAQAIIDARPFNVIEDLTKTYGIGEATLKKIKEQGLACVNVEEEEDEEEKSEENFVDFVEKKVNKTKTKVEEEIITLTTQTIKTQDNNENNSKYPIYGLVGFCILLGVLFVLKKNRYKNEFR